MGRSRQEGTRGEDPISERQKHRMAARRRLAKQQPPELDEGFEEDPASEEEKTYRQLAREPYTFSKDQTEDTPEDIISNAGCSNTGDSL